MTTGERIYWGKCTARAVSAGIMYGSEAIAKMRTFCDSGLTGKADHDELCSAYRRELIRIRLRKLSSVKRLFRVASAIDRYDEQRP